jgi:hypothetical protein
MVQVGVIAEDFLDRSHQPAQQIELMHGLIELSTVEIWAYS